MTEVRSLCVFCGASMGNEEAYAAAAGRLGTLMAKRGIRLIFGAGHVGLMGVLADAVLAAGGEAVGVIPEHLVKRELGHDGLTEIHVVASMHQRKQMMFDLADAIAVLPGGFGTLDETFEVLTWKQIGMHDKPIVLIDVAGYWRPLEGAVRAIVDAGFARREHSELFATAATPDEALDVLARSPASHIPADSTRF